MTTLDKAATIFNSIHTSGCGGVRCIEIYDRTQKCPCYYVCSIHMISRDERYHISLKYLEEQYIKHEYNDNVR